MYFFYGTALLLFSVILLMSKNGSNTTSGESHDPIPQPLVVEAIAAKNDLYDVDSMIEELYSILLDKAAANDPEKIKRVCYLAGELRVSCCIPLQEWRAFKYIMGYDDSIHTAPPDLNVSAEDNKFDIVFKLFKESGMFAKIEERKKRLKLIEEKLDEIMGTASREEISKLLSEYGELLAKDGRPQSEIEREINNRMVQRWRAEKMSERVDSPMHGELHEDDGEDIGWHDLEMNFGEQSDDDGWTHSEIRLLHLTDQLDSIVKTATDEEFNDCLMEYEAALDEAGYSKAEIKSKIEEYRQWRWQCERLKNHPHNPVNMLPPQKDSNDAEPPRGLPPFCCEEFDGDWHRIHNIPKELIDKAPAEVKEELTMCDKRFGWYLDSLCETTPHTWIMFEGVQQMYEEALKKAGVKDDEIEAILGRNQIIFYEHVGHIPLSPMFN